MDTKIISAFPGTGKTWFTDNDWYMGSQCIADSDSGKFDKVNFPANYIEHIKENIGKKCIIFVSSHKVVREALVENGIPFTLIYPDETLLTEYLGRYFIRGNPESFLTLVKNNWSDWMKELQEQKACEHIILKHGQFISNVIR